MQVLFPVDCGGQWGVGGGPGETEAVRGGQHVEAGRGVEGELTVDGFAAGPGHGDAASESLEPKLNRRDSRLSAAERNPRGRGRVWMLCLVPDPPEAWARLPPGASETSPKALAQGPLRASSQASSSEAGSRPPVVWSGKPFRWVDPGKLVAGDLGPDPDLGPSVKDAESLSGRFGSARWEVNVGS